ncbi:AAA-ATPase Vps4-associated protein 1-domain-containing protein, partial [Fomitopsis serialis]|uniref:AAA-ATPase Vps4-associated protein 1-domain-containing protein n=1 Tax=Fomitopsis serialis TaxID=139415 RepID=UPI0020075ABD
MSFQNIYYKRAVATARPCYVCHKPSTTVLATIQTVDFLYTCDTHLSDPASPMGLSPEEIAKVKQEWEDRQKKKTKEKDKDASQDGDKKSDSTEDKDSKTFHERYTLHRDIFALRLAEHRRRRQTAQAKDLHHGFREHPDQPSHPLLDD